MSTDSLSSRPDPNPRLFKTKPVPDGHSAPDDEVFIRRAFGQDPYKGCELLFREYYAPLCSHAVRFVHSQEIARDIVSDTFCVFWQQKRYEQINTSYRAYLYAAVRNRSLKYLQREFGRKPSGSSLNLTDQLVQGLPTNLPNPEALMTYEELRIRVDKTIEQLPPQRQKVFMMSRFEGKKYQTIADELHISRKAVEGHISKALVTLRKVFLDE